MAAPATFRFRGLLLVLLLLGLAILAQPEDTWKKDPSKWSAKEALKLLQKSPWAREVVVSHPPYRQEVEIRSGVVLGDPRAVQPDPSDPGSESYFNAKYLVRWETAVPVARAFARLEELGEPARAKSLGPPPELPKDRYVITVMMTRPPRGGPVSFDRRDLFDDLDEYQLKQRTRLETKRGTVIPEEVERSQVGPIAAMHFFFPRTYKGKPLLRPEREVEVEVVEFRVKGKMFTLKSKFTLELHYLA